MALQDWALPQLSQLLPLDKSELKQIITYTDNLPPSEAAKHFENMLGDSPAASDFIASYSNFRASIDDAPHSTKGATNGDSAPPDYAATHAPDAKISHNANDIKQAQISSKGGDAMFHAGGGSGALQTSSETKGGPPQSQQQSYAPPSHPPPVASAPHSAHSNVVTQAAAIRARDEVRISY